MLRECSSMKFTVKKKKFKICVNFVEVTEFEENVNVNVFTSGY